MSLISKFENPVVVKPGDTVYLGNKFDAIRTKFINLDRTSNRPNIKYDIPKDASEELLEHIQQMIDSRTLSISEPEMSNLRKPAIDEFKSFSTKQVDDMTFSELRYAAEKLKISFDKSDSRDVLKEKINEKLFGSSKKTRRNG